MTSFDMIATEQAHGLRGDVSWAYGTAKPNPLGRTQAAEISPSTRL